MSRIDFLPENDIETTFKKALQDIEELKQVQRLGPDSITPKVLQSEDAFDYTGVAYSFDYEVGMYVKFTAETQENPYIQLFFKIYDMSGTEIDTSTFDAQIYSTFSPAAADGFGGDAFWTFDDKITYAFIAAIRDLAQGNFKVKLFVLASDEGTYEVNRVL